MLVQRTLFPDAFEVQERAFAALDRLELGRAIQLVAEARERDPDLVNLEPLAEALHWLAGEVGLEPVPDELVAMLFLTVPGACRKGELSPAAARLADAALARQGLQRSSPRRAFLDEERAVHRGVLLLALERNAEAYPLLAEGVREHVERADLWLALADAAWAVERPDEGNAACVRALLLGADELELLRLRHPPLAALRDELASRHGEVLARELLLVEAWLAGALAIVPENAWLERSLSRLQLAAAARQHATRAQRLRRFTLLLYLDRSRPPGRWDEAEREEMQALEPELFARVMARVRELEQGQTTRLRW